MQYQRQYSENKHLDGLKNCWIVWSKFSQGKKGVFDREFLVPLIGRFVSHSSGNVESNRKRPRKAKNIILNVQTNYAQ